VPKEIRIVLDEEEYEKLVAVKGSKSWKELLLAHAKIRGEERLITEISRGFDELRKRIILVTEDTNLAMILELCRVIIVRLVKMSHEARENAVKKVEESLEAIIKSLPQEY